MTAFEDERLEARLRQIERGRERVVAAADDYGAFHRRLAPDFLQDSQRSVSAAVANSAVRFSKRDLRAETSASALVS